MSGWAGASVVSAFLDRCSRRLLAVALAEGAALGLAVAAVIALAKGMDWRPGIALAVAFAAAGGAARAYAARRARRAVALAVERRAPESRNIVLTAKELIDDPLHVPEEIGARVCRDASLVAARLDARALFPARRAMGWLAASSAICAAAVSSGGARSMLLLVSPTSDASIERIEVVVAPPPYSGIAERAFTNPSRVEALAGSSLRIRVRAAADSLVATTLRGTIATRRDGSGFGIEVRADEDGFVAFEPVRGGRAGERRLIGVSVTPDLVPKVRITAPAKDMFVPRAPTALDVTFEAEDDLGLATLVLRYTRVSGSGEQFTFTEGTAPVTLTRTDGRRWTGRASLRLDSLVAGDMLVYRGAASDRRPGAPVSESDSYIVEITAPGAVAAAGFAIDDEQDRYGISQQMVIMKTERLIARARALPADSLLDGSRLIAAEQRAVRAEFVFMMGGELAEEVLAAAGLTDLNEEAEAAAEDDIAAGRLANQGRIALLRAIRAMSRANAALTAGKLDTALTAERAALNYLQSAFARSRYILRALTQRERLDLGRRMTGDLSLLLRDVRSPATAPAEPRHAALRRMLADIGALAGAPEFGADESRRATSLAEDALRLDPSSRALQQVASRLTDASHSSGSRARALLDSATIALGTMLKSALPVAPLREGTFDAAALEGAMTNALRRGRGR